MKKILLFTLFAFTCCITNIQAQPAITIAKPGAKNYGIASKMTYEAILNTSISKKELMSNTKSYLVDNLLKPVGLTLDEDEISDDRTDFTVSFGFRQGVYYGKGVMGVRLYKAPVKLFFNARFSFNNEGQIKITFTDFKEEPFYRTREGYYPLESIGDQITDRWRKEHPEAAEIEDKITNVYAESTGETSPLIKALVFMSGGMDEYKSNISDLNKLLNEQFDLYDRAVRAGAGTWMRDVKAITDAYTPKHPGAKYMIPLIQERAESGYLLETDNERWDKYFQKIFTSVFEDVAKVNNGNVYQVAKDGIVLYESVDGKLQAVKKK